MSLGIQDWVALVPAYLPAFLRISMIMIMLPGIGEAVIPIVVRIGIAMGIILALAAALPAIEISAETSLSDSFLIIITEILTGLWFGWLTRLVASSLPMAGQYVSYMMGLSNILQSEVDPTMQSSALSALFAYVVPLVFLSSGLYMLPLKSLAAFFELVPVGHLLPATDGSEASVVYVGKIFLLSLQLASPFIVMAVIWNIIIGQMARLGGRMQIYFLSFPAQILLGLALMIISVGPILGIWELNVDQLLRHLPSGD